MPHCIGVDLLVSERCVPGQSWNDPAERIMSILNLALQIVSLARERGSEDLESSIKRCGSMKQIRLALKDKPELQSEVTESVEPVKTLLKELFSQLDLCDEPFNVREPATNQALTEAFSFLHLFDDTIKRSDVSAKIMSSNEKLKEFLDHCCRCGTADVSDDAVAG